MQAEREQHFGATAEQTTHFEDARRDRSQYAGVNGGRPGTYALRTNRSGFGYGNEVNARQGNQQSRIANGIDGGQITPGESRNLESRDDSIHNEARSDRFANGGYLTNGERAQIDARQNNVSRSIYADKHNWNDDATAGYRNGRTPGQEQHISHQIYRDQRPRGPESHHRP